MFLSAHSSYAALQTDGHTCVMLAVEGRLAAIVSLFDPVKPEARGVVTALQQAGLQCHLLTGDNRRTAAAIARRLAIRHVSAECLPQGKAAKIQVRMHASLLCIFVFP